MNENSMSAVTDDNKKIHVLQVVGEPVGGIRKHVHSIIDGLNSTDYEQSYAYSVTCVDSKFKADLTALKHKLKSAIPLSVKKKPGFGDLRNIYRLVRYVRLHGVNIIHGHGAKGGLYARIVGRFCGIKSVYTPHGGVAHNMFSAFENRLYTFVEKKLYRMTDIFVFESNYSADSFHQKIGCDLGSWLVNYNGVSVSDGCLGRKQSHDQLVSFQGRDAFHVGVFGLIRSQKGQEYAIRAVARFQDAEIPVCLHLFGDGPDREKLEEVASELNVSGNVMFHGDVTNVPEHMCRMDVILIPSLFESFGYVAIEAMSLGIPVVASSVGGLREIITKQTGTLVSPGNVDEIADALRIGMEDYDSFLAKAKLGKRVVEENFTLVRMVDGISGVYQSLCNHSEVS